MASLNLASVLEHPARLTPDRVAVSFQGQQLTYAQLNATADKVAAGLHAMGIRAGDHVVSSSFLFGNTNSLFGTFNTLGCEISFVDATHVDNVARAIRPETRLVFVETIANPRTQIADLARIVTNAAHIRAFRKIKTQQFTDKNRAFLASIPQHRRHAHH